MTGWRFDGYKHRRGCVAVHGWTDADRDGSACPPPAEITGGLRMSAPERCPACGSPNIEEHDPEPGWHTCRDCGYEIEEGEA